MANDSAKWKMAAHQVITEAMESVMNKVLTTEPFVEANFRRNRPLYAALAPIEIFKAGYFERKFTDALGHAWEDLAAVVARQHLGFGCTEYVIEGKVKRERLERIQSVLRRLQHPEQGQARVKPNWLEELSYIKAGGGEDIPVKVVCDVFAKDVVKEERYAFEIKAPQPNSDQTKESKYKLLKLYAMDPPQVDMAYFALPYNPYGARREDYKWKHPKRWFDMQKDSVVLIGTEFWDKVGGVGTFQTFISIANEIGRTYHERIYREFLGVASS